jgi:phosphoribosylformylglycinamidine synthase
MGLLHFYRIPALSPAKKNALFLIASQKLSAHIRDIETEYCFNIEIAASLTEGELTILRWLLAETFEPENFSENSFLVRNNIVIARSETTRQSPLGRTGLACYCEKRRDARFT